MAQKIFIEHEADLESFSENERWLGVLEPGLYRGFDSFGFSGNSLTLNHTLTGIRKTNITGDGFSDRTAIILSKQGSLVHVDTAVVLSVDYNASNTEDRIDYVIGSHEYQNAPDSGLDMVFSIIKGPLDDFSEPSIGDEYNNVLIAKLFIKAGAANHSETRYQRVNPPHVANKSEESISKILKDLSITSFPYTSIDGDEYPTNDHVDAETDDIRWYKLTLDRLDGVLELNSRTLFAEVDLIARIEGLPGVDITVGQELILKLKRNPSITKIGVVGIPTETLGTTGAQFETDHGDLNILIPVSMAMTGYFEGGVAFAFWHRNITAEYQEAFIVLKCVSVDPLKWLIIFAGPTTPVPVP